MPRGGRRRRVRRTAEMPIRAASSVTRGGVRNSMHSSTYVSTVVRHSSAVIYEGVPEGRKTLPCWPPSRQASRPPGYQEAWRLGGLEARSCLRGSVEGRQCCLSRNDHSQRG